MDIAKSSIYGGLSLAEPGGLPNWSLSVQCGPARLMSLEGESEEDLRERREWFEFASGEGCHASIDDLVFPLESWRDLAGQRVSIELEHTHPIMPDDPGEFYFEAHHWSADRNQIAIGSRRNNAFSVRWKFVAEDDEENMAEVEVEANIPVGGLRVGFQDPSELSVPAAIQAVRRFAEEGDLGEPFEQFDRYIMVPIIGDVD